MNGDQRVTLRTVARAAGVSVPTVSRVLNGSGLVSEATRARIESLLRRYDYRPRNAGPARSPGLIQVFYPRIDTEWQAEHLRGMESVMHDAGLGLVVSALDRAPAGAGQARMDGAILAAASGDSPLGAALAELDIPLIALDPAAKAEARLPTIAAANWTGARRATEHLIELGHRRIGVVTGSRGGLTCSRARLDGYRAALEDAQIPEDPSLIEHGEFAYGAGVTAAGKLLDRADPPTAIFAFSDHIALGVLEAARLREVPVPARLSVVGFDDLPAARWASPALTTVRQPLQDMGRLAAQTVLRLVRRERIDSSRMELSTRLIVRESTSGRDCRRSAGL